MRLNELASISCYQGNIFNDTCNSLQVKDVPFILVTYPGWVQARYRHFRGGPEERSADPPRFSYSCHRLQQESLRTEAQNLRLESLSAAGTVSYLSLNSKILGFEILQLFFSSFKFALFLTKPCYFGLWMNVLRGYAGVEEKGVWCIMIYE